MPRRHQSSTSSILAPPSSRRGVIAFSVNAKGIATTGYRGSLVRVLPSSVMRHPIEPWLWIHRVWLPRFSSYIDVPTTMLRFTGDFEPEAWIMDGCCEVQFDFPSRDDDPEVFGAYRLPRENWTDFHFRKAKKPIPAFRFAMPVEKRSPINCKLTYFVPMKQTLDREFVLSTLAKSILPKGVQVLS